MWRVGTNISPNGGRRDCRHPRTSWPLRPRFTRFPRFPRFPRSPRFPRFPRLPRLPRTLRHPPRPRRRYPHRSRYLCPIRRSYRDPCYLRRGSRPLLLHHFRYPHRSRYLCPVRRSYRDPCHRSSFRRLRSHGLPSDRSRARIRLHSLLHPRPPRNPRPLYVYRPVSAAARPLNPQARVMPSRPPSRARSCFLRMLSGLRWASRLREQPRITRNLHPGVLLPPYAPTPA